MPELPEVETVVRALRRQLVGQTVTCLTLHRPDIVRPPTADLAHNLVGHSFLAIRRRGKRILLLLDHAILCIHLGMTGQLTLAPPTAPHKPHTHLVAGLSNATQLRFRDPRRFGSVRLLPSIESASQDLGPEPLNLSATSLSRLLATTRRAIKSALLDQSLVAGLGNIYADESLFAARIHPLTPANRLSPMQIRQLNQSIKRVLRRAIRHGGSSIRDYISVNGTSGRFQDLHAVYARTGQPCTCCHTPIARVIVSSRSTHFCPRCQPVSC